MKTISSFITGWLNTVIILLMLAFLIFIPSLHWQDMSVAALGIFAIMAIAAVLEAIVEWRDSQKNKRII